MSKCCEYFLVKLELKQNLTWNSVVYSKVTTKFVKELISRLDEGTEVSPGERYSNLI
jgi:hypothetical protein